MTFSPDRILFRLLLLLVVLAPLPFGAQRPWAWGLLSVWVGLLLLAWGGFVAAGRIRQPVAWRRILPVALPFLLVLAWALLQSVGGIAMLPSHPLWEEALRELGRPAHAPPVSPDPAMTRDAVLRLASYAGIFLLALQLGRDGARAREGLVAFAAAGAAYAIWGLASHLAGWELLLPGQPKWAYVGDLTSTFVNRNSYGAYAGLGLLAAVGLFIHALPIRDQGRRRRARDLVEAVLLRASPYLVASLFLGTALLLSHSRGALLATAGGVVVLLAALTLARMLQVRHTAMAGAAMLAAAGLLLAVSGEGTLQRFMEITQDDAGRVDLARLSIAAIRDAPWTGTGLGTFERAFSLYRDASLPMPVVWDYAHNAHLELAMDLGIPAALLFYAFLAAALAMCVLALRRRHRDKLYPAVALSAAALLGLHGLIDFSVQIPAIAASFAFLLGLGCAQYWQSAELRPGEA